MTHVVYALAVIGGFCVLCFGAVLAAVAANALTRQARHRDAAIWHVTEPDLEGIANRDRAFLTAIRIDPDRLAHHHRSRPC